MQSTSCVAVRRPWLDRRHNPSKFGMQLPHSWWCCCLAAVIQISRQ